MGILLSTVAGFVNVGGFFAVGRLTTNVTGHFAFFIDGIFKLQYGQAIVFLAYIAFFFLGAMVSRMLSESASHYRPSFGYIAPVMLEMILISSAASTPEPITYPDTIAYILLFAMGVQNSLVTSISGSTVRTTHLTGLFTDLGIDTARFCMNREINERRLLRRAIGLRLAIVLSFFGGGILGGCCYVRLGLASFFIPVALLGAGIAYDLLIPSTKQAMLRARK